MTDAANNAAQGSPSNTSLISRVARRLVWRRLESLVEGRVTVDDGGQCREFGRSGDGSLAATIAVRDPRFYRHLVLGGSLGAAEAYIRGYWTCDDLVSLVRIFCRNAAAASGLEGGLARVLSPLARMAHWLRRNTLSGSRRNIAAHYDLGNEFFALFLDETMAYSCGVFPQPASTLHEASVAKFDRVCRKLGLTADDHVLEIGSGWGGFAVHAAGQYGCRVTTTTISRKQYEYTRQRIQTAGLADRVTVLCEDYRVLQGSFDKLVSIEMIEAVGLSVLRHLLPRLLRAAQAARHDALAGDCHSRPALRCLPAVDGLHPALHLPRRLPAFAGGHLPFAGPRNRSAGLPPGGHHRALRRNPGTLAAAVPCEP